MSSPKIHRLRRVQLWIASFVAALFIVLPAKSRAIVFGQVDNFQDGTTMSWSQGGSSPNQPTNISSGGPAGAGDKYLQNISTGGFGAGSKMVVFNQAQWTGDYVSAGVNRITVQMTNTGATTLNMRIAIESASGTIFGSNSAVVLPPDGLWYSANFDLTAASMTNIGGSETLDQALGHIILLRLLSSVGGPSFNGDPIQATLGLDNVTATSIAVPPPSITQFIFASGTPRISFTTVSGQTYRVERKNSLTDANWVAVTNGDNLPGNGGVLQVSDTDPGVASLPHRFYRVVLL